MDFLEVSPALYLINLWQIAMSLNELKSPT
jgi:hypothetical protein